MSSQATLGEFTLDAQIEAIQERARSRCLAGDRPTLEVPDDV